MNDDREKSLDERLAHLEDINRSRIMALELIRDLSDFNESVNRLKDPDSILEKCRGQVEKLINVKTLAFFLIDEKTSDFTLYSCYPRENREQVESELAHFVEDGTFSRAVLERKPVTAGSLDFTEDFLFHVMATVSRVRGMCVVILDGGARKVPEAAFELLSILMTHCANALESYELYSCLKGANQALEEKVDELSASQASLKKEIAEHEKTFEALKVSESQYRRLAETAREMIMTVSGRGRITYMNPYGTKLAGYSFDELKGMDVGMLLAGFDMVRKQLHMIPESEFTTRLIRKGGEEIPLEISLAPILDSNGSPGFLIMGRNISDRLKADAEKQELEQRLWQARKMESIGLLAGGTAHDFNNLLSVIVNYTDLSLEVLGDDHPVAKYLDRVETAALQAIDLSKKLYTIGREDRHDTHPVDLNPLMAETLKLLRPSLGKTLSLEFDKYPGPLMVMAEETRLRQVLMNLISNAAHAMEKGTILVGGERVQMFGSPEQAALGVTPGPYIKVWVKDTGPGISPDALPRIFEPYYSTKDGEGNAGLGLAVVHGIVNSYGGAIEVESTLSRGTCFCIYLPEADPA
ncbi:MAG: ATP-binding protein [Desulfobacter sp.]